MERKLRVLPRHREQRIVAPKNVLATIVMLRIVSEITSTFVVAAELRRAIDCRTVETLDELAVIDHVFCCFGESDDLGFHRGKRSGLLLARIPKDGCALPL